MPPTGAGRPRREVLRAAAGATGLISGLAGCSAVAEDLPFGGPAPLDLVPADAAGVVHVADPAALDDGGVVPLVDGRPGGSGAGIDLPPGPVNERTTFASYADYGLVGEYHCTVHDADWSEAATVEAHEQYYGVEYAPETYTDRTVYAPTDGGAPHVGVVESGVYVVGSRAAVEAVVDVDRGETPPLGDPVRSGFEATRAAPVRYAGEVPAWLDGELSGPGEEQFDLEPFREVVAVTGSVSRTGDDRGAVTTVRAEDGDAAADVEALLARYVAAVEGSDAVLAGSTVERTGRDVVVRHGTTVEEVPGLLAGASAPAGSLVQARASLRTDGDAVVVEWTANRDADHLVVHVAGCRSTAARLEAVGERARFAGCYGDVNVVVTAHGDGAEAVVLVRTVRI